ncbi:MAG: FKBP-type peptidyl-prolyl cis-trans isomerase [Bifidobacteriaceae bacterium]|jgi:peptidylprolyl isomerase|nr:FKBP-type peptidyl-prolyl cis-trans isomerase [Bifidobacteriaceae bacterium]
MRRRIIRVAALSAAVACGVGACSTPSVAPPSGSTAAPPASAAPTSAAPTPSPTVAAIPSIEPDPEADALTLEQIVWLDGGEGAPRLAFAPPLGVTGPVARVVDQGAGKIIEAGNSVTFHYAMFFGDTGELAYSTWDEDAPETISAQPTGMSQTFAGALIGNRVGADIIFATIDSSQTTLAANLVTMFMAVTVIEARELPSRAEGKALRPKAGLPTVRLAANGAPSVTIPSDRVAPHELVAEPLILGAGPSVVLGQTVTVKFTGWLWDGTEFDSTWEDEASMAWRLARDETMPGLLDGLLGSTVGSQVLLIIPPDLGFGEIEMEGIPPGSTLVYVIDILDAR